RRIADHLSGRHAPRTGAAESVQKRNIPPGGEISRGGVHSGVPRQPVSQHAEGYFFAGAADLLGAFRRATGTRCRRDEGCISGKGAAGSGGSGVSTRLTTNAVRPHLDRSP